ncbi:hypothetical protein A9R12_13895 [Aeromonas hydrophila]|nr:hypothetical protein A9R12_13895 [Aeromonas hydrophila]
MLIGPFMGHGWFKLVFVGWGVGACPHEGGSLLTGGRLAALQGQAFLPLLWRRPASWPAQPGILPGELANQDDLNICIYTPEIMRNT